MSIDSATLAVTRRYYDPYGNPLGAAPGSWPGTKGFVGGTADSVTGLTNLGAREYSPGTGSFVTTDPVLNPYDPRDLNPYAYASDNPATSSDPSGLCDSAGCRKTHAAPAMAGAAATGNHSGPAPGDGTTSSGCPAQPPRGGLCPRLEPGPIPRRRPTAPGRAHPPRPHPPPGQHRQRSRDSGLLPEFLFKDGACPSERGAAGTTPQEVRSSALGAGGILLSALPIGDLFGLALDSEIGSSILDGDVAASCGGRVSPQPPGFCSPAGSLPPSPASNPVTRFSPLTPSPAKPRPSRSPPSSSTTTPTGTTSPSGPGITAMR